MRQDASGTIWTPAYFRQVPVGQAFWSNGNKWHKKSSRTARMVYPESYAGKTFYFRQGELCERQFQN
jgi:hypothetical protein